MVNGYTLKTLGTWNLELGTRNHPSATAHRFVEVLVAVAVAFTASSFAEERPQPTPCLTQSEVEEFEPSVREEAQRAYQDVQADPSNPEAHGRLGMILHALEHPAALACYERALLVESAAPDSPERASPASPQRTSSSSWKWAYYQGVLQLEAGRVSEAAATLRKATRLNPDYVPAQLKLAESLLAIGEWGESQRIYEAMFKANPGVALAHYGLGRLHSARGELKAAVESYRRACQLAPGFRATHYALGMAYRDLGETMKAREQFALFWRNTESKPSLEDPLMNEIETLRSGVSHHLGRGLRRQMTGQAREAVAEFQRALKLKPDYARTHIYLISAYLDLRELEKAEEHYQAAVKLAPDAYEAHYNFGLVLLLQGKHQEAIDTFSRVVRINPYHAQSHKNLGLLFLDQRNLTEAEAHLRLAVKNRPHFGDPHFALGNILQSQGKNTEAIDHFLKALTLENENDYLFLYSLADTYARSGNHEKAVEYARKAKQRAVFLGQTTAVPEIEKLLRELEETGRTK